MSLNLSFPRYHELSPDLFTNEGDTTIDEDRSTITFSRAKMFVGHTVEHSCEQPTLGIYDVGHTDSREADRTIRETREILILFPGIAWKLGDCGCVAIRIPGPEELQVLIAGLVQIARKWNAG